MAHLKIVIILVLSLFSVIACKDSKQLLAGPQTIALSSAEKGELESFKSDQWDFSNHPELLGLPMTYDMKALPRQGQVAESPWPDTYWPTVEDSYNVRWQEGQLSALEKYDLAFNGWVPPIGFEQLRPLTPRNCQTGQWDRAYYDQLGPAAKAWSRQKGNYIARNGVDDDGDGLVDECDDMDGMDLWWGSCHAWVPASILEKEPLEAVEYRGVRFEVSDIKALLMMKYEESRQIAIGERCLEVNPRRDQTGRIMAPDCRNINAGTFHLILSNLVGLMERSLGEDRTNGAAVWNHPILGYQVIEQREVSERDAAILLGGSPEGGYPYNERASSFLEMRTQVRYLTESPPSTEAWEEAAKDFTRSDTYHYLLELDEQGRVIGGEWIAQKTVQGGWRAEDRPDYLWLPLGQGKMLISEVDEQGINLLHRLSRPETRDNEVRVFRSAVNELIPDWPWEGLSDEIIVDERFTPSLVKVNFSISHDFIYDLSVRLKRGEEEVVLFDRKPKGSNTSIVDSVILPQFAGQDAMGVWTLIATDHNGRSVGRFLDWSIHLEVTE